jgi:PKD repeat protein
MNKLYNTFENQLRDKLAGHEMPYEPQHWNDLQSSLRPQGRSSSALLVALLATFTFLGGIGIASYQAINLSSSAKVASNKDLGLQASVARKAQTKSTVVAPSIDSMPVETNDAITSNLSMGGRSDESTAQNSGEINPETNASSELATNANPIVTELPNPAENQKKKLAFAPSVSMACAGSEIEFKVTSLPDGVTGNYIWNFGDGKFKAETAPSNIYTKPGHYDVSLSITDDNGRITTTVLNKAIVIVPTPKADFTWHFDNTDPARPAIKVVNTSANATASEWTMKDGTKMSDINPSIDLISQGKHMLALQVTNQYGCSNGTVKHISVNSDLNLGASKTLKISKETFMPEALKPNKHNFVLTIYDQSGNAVYETSNRSKGWDGTLNGGRLASIGENYQWRVLIINDLTKEEKYFNGTLNIIP